MPPHNIEAEKAVLGSMLLNGCECVDTALEKLMPDDFYQPLHRDIFATMVELAGSGLELTFIQRMSVEME